MLALLELMYFRLSSHGISILVRVGVLMGEKLFHQLPLLVSIWLNIGVNNSVISNHVSDPAGLGLAGTAGIDPSPSKCR